MAISRPNVTPFWAEKLFLKVSKVSQSLVCINIPSFNWSVNILNLSITVFKTFVEYFSVLNSKSVEQVTTLWSSSFRDRNNVNTNQK